MGKKSHLGGDLVRETYRDGTRSMDYTQDWDGYRHVEKIHRHNSDGTTDTFDPDDLPLSMKLLG